MAFERQRAREAAARNSKVYDRFGVELSVTADRAASLLRRGTHTEDRPDLPRPDASNKENGDRPARVVPTAKVKPAVDDDKKE